MHLARRSAGWGLPVPPSPRPHQTITRLPHMGPRLSGDVSPVLCRLALRTGPPATTSLISPTFLAQGTPTEHPGAEALTPVDREPTGLSPLRAGWERLVGDMCVCTRTLPLCMTLCNPMDCSPLGSSAYGILQARILEWAAMPSSRRSSQLRDLICVSCPSCIGS